MKKSDLPKLASDLTASYEAAKARVEGVEDRGSCNFDSVALWGVPWTKEVAALLTGHGYSTTWLGRKCILISPPVSGQANRRSLAMEAMRESLKQAGWDVSGFYQMD